MEELLETTFFNVDIELIEGISTQSNIDSLLSNNVDIALIENYVAYEEGINSAFAVYSEVLHIFYHKDITSNSFEELMSNHTIYIGPRLSPTYNLMMDLFDFYGLDASEMDVTFNMAKSEVIVVLTNLFSREELIGFRDYRLFSFDSADNYGNGSIVEGISLKYPRLSPFLIPESTYRTVSEGPVLTLSVELIMIVRSSMGQIAVTDFTKTMLQNRQVFSPIDPLLYNGLREDFDRSRLNIPLHEGARVFLDRDEPGFLERYAELGGVILSIVIAVGSGIVSLARWQIQKKKDRIDDFYEDLLQVKNEIPKLKNLKDGALKIREIQTAQNKAFEMLISEELLANDSFRIYMELSKETINELRAKMRALNTIKEKREKA
jgi:TRAP-type uncharacterized transport system substrate-binding protein